MADPSVGAVTFLFSDIVGSTARWEEHGSAMRDALARHDEIIATSVAEHGGQLVKSTGDGALAAFVAAAGAVGAAIEIQRSMADEDWQDVGGVSVRIGVHTGDAEQRDGDYFGPAVNRASRLVDAAHGGQILVSRATAGLVVDQLPDGVSLIDLGEHHLPDVSRPDRISQVVAPGLADRFPPLRTAEPPTTNLPTPRTSFIGRSRDLETLADLITERRIVTLTGPGGAGKTRLAVELGRSLIPTFDEGVSFCDLATVTEEALVAKAVADAVGLPGPAGIGTATGRPVIEDLEAFVSAKRMLVVIDNCEHLLDGSAQVVDRLLKAGQHLHVIATSREALRIPGEHVWPVGPLQLPDEHGDDLDEGDAEALRLLLDRVRAVRPELDLTDQDRAAMARIARGLDGIPLALELAASRIAHLSPAEVADRLADRFALLRGGRRGDRRHGTLEAAVDWSYELLDDDEKATLRRLSVFSGGFTFEAAEAVAATGLGGPPLELLGSLVDRSLVNIDRGHHGRTRYRLLETIRLYAADKLAVSGEETEVRDRHRDWYLGSAESVPWDRAVMAPTAAGLGAELGNLRRAVDWSRRQERTDLVARLTVAATGLLALNGHVEEAENWQAAARSAEDLSPELEAQLAVCAAWTGIWTGRRSAEYWRDEVSPELTAALETLPADHPAAALAWYMVAAVETVVSLDPVAIETAADETLAAARRADAPLIASLALQLKGVARLYAGDYPAGITFLEEAIRSQAHADAPDEAGTGASVDLGIALHLTDQNDRAIQLLAPRLELRRDFVWRYLGHLATGVAAAGLGDRQRAVASLEEAVRAFRKSRWRVPVGANDCLIGYGALFAMTGDDERASRCLAASAGVATFPSFFVLYRHYRDLLRQRLDRETRRRLVEEGRRAGPDEVLADAVDAAAAART